jgi:tetratricopeptide (TPR) repeat protein
MLIRVIHTPSLLATVATVVRRAASLLLVKPETYIRASWRHVLHSAKEIKRSKTRHFGIFKGLLVLAVTTPVITMADLSDIAKQADEYLDKNDLKAAYDLLNQYKDKEDTSIQWKFARICYRYGKYHPEGQAKGKDMAEIGMTHADRAIALDPNCHQAYRWKGILLNWSTEFDGYKKKIEKSYEIRDNFTKACELNPNDSETIHLLGRWCYEVSDVPWYMKKAASYLLATLPETSYAEALENFEKAESNDPGFYAANTLYIGKCHLALGNKPKAKEWLQKVVEFEDKGIVLMGDDIEAIEEAKKLLSSL